jgi:hypothetical protein
MSADEIHAPTSAGPGGARAEVGTDKSPTFEVPRSDAPPLERPEVQVGAAFAGGLLAALILKRLGG